MAVTEGACKETHSFIYVLHNVLTSVILHHSVPTMCNIQATNSTTVKQYFTLLHFILLSDRQVCQLNTRMWESDYNLTCQ